MKKIGELRAGSAHFVIFCDPTRANPYRIVRKWWDAGWHQKTEAVYADLCSVTEWLAAYVRRNR